MRRRLALGICVALGAGLGLVLPIDGADAVVCTIDQVTFTPAGRVSGSNLDLDRTGNRLVFESNAAFDGLNADLSTEVWSHERVGGLTVPFSGGTSPAVSVTPTIDGEGRMEVYASTTNPVGQNADLNRELFIRDETFATTRQLTTSTGGTVGNLSPSIDDAGDRVAFISDRNLDGTNPDLNAEIYLVSIFGPVALTNTTGGGTTANSEPHLSADGRFVAYASTREPVGTVNFDANREIFRLELSTGNTVQVTNTTGGTNAGVAIDGDGDVVAFTSNRNLTGGNADLSQESFVHNLSTGTTTQLTSAAANEIASVALATDGSRVTYLGDPTVESGAESEAAPEGTVTFGLFARDLATNTLTPIAEGNSFSGANPTAVNDRGTRVLFSTDLNLTGDNPDFNREVHLATCGRGTPVFGDVGTSNQFFQQIQWMSGAEIAGGFPDGTFHPQEFVKRQQMANFLFNTAAVLFAGPGDPTFNDVPNANPFYDQIEWMAATEVASGFPDGGFHPQEFVKRQQMANFLYNLAGQPSFTPPATPTFNDVPASNPFFLQIEWMADEDIASGFPDGGFHPQESVKRQQMANFLFNFSTCCDAAANF